MRCPPSNCERMVGRPALSAVSAIVTLPVASIISVARAPARLRGTHLAPVYLRVSGDELADEVLREAEASGAAAAAPEGLQDTVRSAAAGRAISFGDEESLDALVAALADWLAPGLALPAGSGAAAALPAAS